MSKHINYNGIDYLILGATFFLFLASLIYIGMEYSNLPETVPSHFNAQGEVDSYESKSILWIVTGIFGVVAVGLYFLAKSTSVHNIQLRSKEANFRSIAVFMPFIALVNSIVVYSIIQSAKGPFSFSKWILPLLLVITIIFLIIMFRILYTNKKS